MELELETTPESAPFLTFTPGNVTFMPVIDIQAFVLLPTSSDRKLLFQLRVVSLISWQSSKELHLLWGKPLPSLKD